MIDVLEQDLRAALSERAEQLDPDASARLRSHDYRPRRHRIPVPAVGALGAGGVAAGVAILISLGSAATPAFAGWQATPTPLAPGQVAPSGGECGQGLGTPVLTDSRGPYTASIYDDATTSELCLSGAGISMSSTTNSTAGIGPGQVGLHGRGMQDSTGDALTLVDGRVGAGVTAVTINRADGSSVQATVAGGWYLAWWPGTTPAATAEVTTAGGTASESFPTPPSAPAASCPPGGRCASSYGFGSGDGTSSFGQDSQTTAQP